ncbi:MAG: LamG domain-containing protein, partial [Sedimentisphaerales bacterium]|nr:LamG domain-containing protein [Sedimentisphaerales bacterium]
MRRFCWSIACLVLLSLTAGTVQADTVAYWRFEEGTAGGCATGNYDVVDSSGNGNHIASFDPDCNPAGFQYRDSVSWSEVPATGEANNLCWRTSGDWPSSTTDSALTNPTGIDAEVITPLEWTVEATIKVSQYAPTWRCFVGRDSYGLCPGTVWASSFYLQVDPENRAGVRFIDMAGYYYTMNSAAGLIQGFDPGADPDGTQAPWYHLAAVSDGEILRLYVAEDGGEYVLAAQQNLAAIGSPDTRLSAGQHTRPPHGHPWHGGAWTVGRGLWDSFHNDRGRGFIDEVRISNEALPVHEFLGYHRTLARNPIPADGETEVLPEVTFAWDVPADPANPTQVHPDLQMYKLYLQESATDPNWAAPIDITPTGLTATHGPV